MGLAERGYYKEDQRGGYGSGGGFRPRGLSAWSVTTWIIVINAAIFAIDTFLSNSGIPVYRGDVRVAETIPPKERQAVLEPYITIDAGGRPVEADAKRVGTKIFRAVHERQDDDSIGRLLYYQEFHVQPPLEAIGHFSTSLGFGRIEVWRLVTFQFLHDHSSIWHIAFNMFALWMFGTLVEEQLGRRKYLAFYLVCGIFGGLLYLILNLLGQVIPFAVPGVLFNDPRTPLIGASAGVFGVIMACAYIVPGMRVYIFFLPFAFRMKTVAYVWVAFAVINLLFGKNNQGGDAAHLGGVIAGAYFIRNSHLLLDFFDVFGDSRKKPGGSKNNPTRGPRRSTPPKPSAADKQQAREEAQIDAILAKIQDEGIGSLTAREKKLLARDTDRKRNSPGGGGPGGRG